MFYLLKRKRNVSCLCFKAAFVSTHHSNRERQVILLINPNGKGCEAKSEGRRRNYVTVKKISALLRVITCKQHGDLYCLNAFILFQSKTNMNLIKN